MKDDITIPPAALEEAAKAICKDAVDIFRPCKISCFVCRSNARAACLAMLKAWPGATSYGPHSSGHGPSRTQLILPLPQKEPTND